MLDNNGQQIDQTYGRILLDPWLERRIKAFDANLRLMYDQGRKKWVVLEKALDGSGTFNVILTCEDKDGNARTPGDWILNRLFVYRHNYEEKRRIGVDCWLNNLRSQIDDERQREEQALSDNNQAMLKDDIVQWRKVNREMRNEPTSDVTAGYQKGASA
jgi:hypothetical protein